MNILNKKSWDIEYSILNEDTKQVNISKYNWKEEILEIPSSIDWFKIWSIWMRAFANNKNIKEIYLPKDLEIIMAWAFSWTNLDKIHISKKTDIKNFYNLFWRTIPKTTIIEYY